MSGALKMIFSRAKGIRKSAVYVNEIIRLGQATIDITSGK
jgi:hypothetical protein